MQALALCLLLATADPLDAFARDFDARFEQLNHKSNSWDAQALSVSGRRVVGGRFVELRGTFSFHALPKPVELVFLWSFDPFQKRIRLAILDDFAGLLDVFEQVGTDPLRVSNVPHGTYFAVGDAKGYTRLAIRFLEGGAIRIDGDFSTDEGKTWSPSSRLTLTPRR